MMIMNNHQYANWSEQGSQEFCDAQTQFSGQCLYSINILVSRFDIYWKQKPKCAFCSVGQTLGHWSRRRSAISCRSCDAPAPPPACTHNHQQAHSWSSPPTPTPPSPTPSSPSPSTSSSLPSSEWALRNVAYYCLRHLGTAKPWKNAAENELLSLLIFHCHRQRVCGSHRMILNGFWKIQFFLEGVQFLFFEMHFWFRPHHGHWTDSALLTVQWIAVNICTIPERTRGKYFTLPCQGL